MFKISISSMLILGALLFVSPNKPWAAITSGTVEYDLPDLGTVFLPPLGGPISFTAPTNVTFFGYISNDISANSIDIDLLSTGSFFAYNFQGEVFRLTDPIGGISVNQNMGAVVSLNGPNEIDVNFSGTNYTDGQTFVDIQVSPVPTPEPGTLLLMGVGTALGLGFRRLRVKKI